MIPSIGAARPIPVTRARIAVALSGGICLVVAAIYALGGPGTERGAPHTVLLVVLDTVRAQNLGLCGHERPNSPFLEELAATRGVSSTCQAYTPGTWTLPSHASFFTGLTVPEHGLGQYILRLSPSVTTLAETLRDRGYQTAMVSGNPSLTETTGLTQGFETVVHARVETPLRGRRLARAVRRVLAAADPLRPMFLFVNVYDAHDPYPGIPEGVPWVPPQEPVHLFSADLSTERRSFLRYTRGRMPAEEAAIFLERVRNGYDYGVSRADDTLRRVFEEVAASGRLERNHRWIVTSDHGEFLGEHQNLRHGCFVAEEVTRVPVLYRDSESEPVELRAPFAALDVYHLLEDGALPAGGSTVASVSIRHARGRPSATMVAVWASPTDKIVWKEGEYLRYDLTADPGETAPTPLDEHPLRPVLEALATRHQEGLKRQVEESPELRRLLRRLGYVDAIGEGPTHPSPR